MKPTRPAPLATAMAAAIAATTSLATTPAAAQWSASAGYEMTTGKYGKAESTDESSIPVSVVWRKGPWRLRAAAALANRVEGDAIAAAQDGEIEEPEPGETPEPGAGSFAGTRSQTGLGDLNLSAFYTLWDAGVARPGLSVGARLKTPLASKDKCLVTNGETDYSIEARAFQDIGAIEISAALGWTKRGDPQRRDQNCVATGGSIDLKNPLYTRLGVSMPLAADLSLDVQYQYRQKIRAGGDPESELTAGIGWRLNRNVELVGYAMVGFSDASPDRGLGATVVYRF